VAHVSWPSVISGNARKKSGAVDARVPVVVRDAASAAAFETSTANKAFRTTSALNRK